MLEHSKYGNTKIFLRLSIYTEKKYHIYFKGKKGTEWRNKELSKIHNFLRPNKNSFKVLMALKMASI